MLVGSIMSDVNWANNVDYNGRENTDYNDKENDDYNGRKMLIIIVEKKIPISIMVIRIIMFGR